MSFWSYGGFILRSGILLSNNQLDNITAITLSGQSEIKLGYNNILNLSNAPKLL